MSRILIVGCGSIGRRHAMNLAPMAELAVVDARPELAQAVAAEYGAASFASVDAALESFAPRAVVVATPNDLHLPVARRAIEAGCDVLVEKPISHSPDGVEEFLDRAEALDRKVFVVCNMRFHPAVRAIRDAMAEIGAPRFARAWYGNYLPDMRPGADYRQLYCARRATGGGVILDAIHEIDYLMWLLGDVEAITCAADRLSDMDIDVEDYAVVALRHAGRRVSEIHLDYLQRYKQRGCELVGQNGTVTWRSLGKRPERCEVRLYTATSGVWRDLMVTDDLDNNRPYVDMMRAFLDALDGAPTDLLTGRQALRDLQVALAAVEAGTPPQP